MAWWRAYDEAVDDPKLQLLPLPLFRAWFNVMCLASANGGIVPPLPTVSFKLHVGLDAAASILRELQERQLLEPTGEKDTAGNAQLRPHNWLKRQYKDLSTGRVKRFRERQRNRYTQRDGNVSVTVPETETEKVSPLASSLRSEANGAAAQRSSTAAKKTELYQRAIAVLGKASGGLVTKLLKARGQDIDIARADIEEAAHAADPREYIGGVIRKYDNPFPGLSPQL